MKTENSCRSTVAARLRKALSDGKWHYTSELKETVGHRFSAPILVVRMGLDSKPALEIESEPAPGSEVDTEWRYRSLGPAQKPYVPTGRGSKSAELRAQLQEARDLFRVCSETDDLKIVTLAAAEGLRLLDGI